MTGMWSKINQVLRICYDLQKYLLSSYYYDGCMIPETIFTSVVSFVINPLHISCWDWCILGIAELQCHFPVETQ